MNLEDQHVVIVGVPLVDAMHAPLAAPAVLKASLARAGIRSTAIDLNIEVLVKLKSHPDRDQLIKFFFEQTVEDWAVEHISKILYYSAQRIADQRPTVIALSLLTYECQIFTLWLCLLLRQYCPDARIVIGGPGVKSHVANFDDSFRTNAKSLGLIDDWVSGDGDQTLIEYVQGNYDYPGINSDFWQPTASLDDLPYPDWSDYNFFLYSQNFIPVVDSKGCVRNCEFCDVIEYWNKFQSRKAENIFQEMLTQMDRFNNRNIDFRSSISNGNLKEFRRLLQMMYDYNQGRYRCEQISWNASFIVRPRSQHPEEMWQQMAATHATLSIGIESVVPHVRKQLGKHFENEDIVYHFEMARKHQVKLIVMIITGYPTETVEDYEYTKQWFRAHAQYKDVVTRLFLSPLTILPGTALARNRKKYKITIDGQHNWRGTVDLATRQAYHQELVAICRDELGFNLDAY